MIDFTGALTIINLVIAIGVIIGGYIAIKSSINQAASTIQERVRQGLLDENDLLQTRLERCEAKIETITQLIAQKGYTLIVSDDIVTLEGGGRASSISKRISRKVPEKENT
jgi:hypothetical protein